MPRRTAGDPGPPTLTSTDPPPPPTPAPAPSAPDATEIRVDAAMFRQMEDDLRHSRRALSDLQASHDELETQVQAYTPQVAQLQSEIHRLQEHFRRHTPTSAAALGSFQAAHPGPISVTELSKLLQMLERIVPTFSGTGDSLVGTQAPGPWLLHFLRHLHHVAPTASDSTSTDLMASRLTDIADVWMRGVANRNLPFMVGAIPRTGYTLEELRVTESDTSVVGQFIQRFCPFTSVESLASSLKASIDTSSSFDPDSVLDTILAHQQAFGHRLSNDRIWSLFLETLPADVKTALIASKYDEYDHRAARHDYRWLCLQASRYIRARKATGLPSHSAKNPRVTNISHDNYSPDDVTIMPVRQAPFAGSSTGSINTSPTDPSNLMQTLQDLQAEVLRLKGCVMDNVVMPAYNLRTAYPEDRGYVRPPEEQFYQYRPPRQDVNWRLQDSANRRVQFADKTPSSPRPPPFRSAPPSSPGSTSRPLHSEYATSPLPYAAPPPRSPSPSPSPVYNSPRADSGSNPARYGTRYRNQGGYQRNQDAAYDYGNSSRGVRHLSGEPDEHFYPSREDYEDDHHDTHTDLPFVNHIPSVAPPADHDQAIEEEQNATYDDKGHPSLPILRKPNPSFTIPFWISTTKGRVRYKLLVDSGADYTVLSLSVLTSMGVPLTQYIDESNPDKYRCFDVNSHALSVVGILKTSIRCELRARDSSIDSIVLVPHCTAQDGTHSVVVICDSPMPFPLILGWVHMGYNRLLVDPHNIEIRRGTLTFRKHMDISVPHRTVTTVRPISPLSEPCTGVFLAAALHHIQPLQTVVAPVWVVKPILCTRKEVIGDILFIPDDNFITNSGICSTAAILDEKDPFIILTNTNLHPMDLTIYSKLGALTMIYRPQIRTICTVTPTVTLDRSFGDTSLPSIHPSLSPQDSNRVRALLSEFTDVFHNDFSKHAWDATPASIQVQANAKPFHANPYRLPEAHHDAMKLFLQKFLESGIIKPSNSPWAAPAFLVPKPNGGLRFVIDYRVLNNATIRCHWPLPNIEDLLYRLRGAQMFSAFDAHTGFHQMKLDEEAQELSSFITSFGQYKYTRLPMGLVNAPSMFMRAMSEFSQGLSNILVYVDDITLFNNGSSSDILDIHLTLLQRFFDRCRTKCLKLNGKKSVVCAPEIKFLGHRITRDGIFPSKDKVEAVKSFQTPTNVKSVRGFLGLINYYRRWIPNCARLQEPLIALTRKDCTFKWTDACETAFQALKKALSTDCVRHFPNPSLPYYLETDSSDYAIASALTQYGNDPNSGKVLGYYSRTLSAAEQNYAAFEKETLAVVASIVHFRQYLATQQLFYVLTDHRSLTTVLRWKDPPRRVARWLATLTEYSFQTIYRPGSQNLNADALSRLASKNVQIPPVSELPARVVCRDGALLEEGKFDRDDGGQLTFVATLTPGTAVENTETPEPTSESTSVVNSPPPIFDGDKLFSLYGQIFYDTDLHAWFRIGDVVYDEASQHFKGLRISHALPGNEPSMIPDEWLPIEYFLRHLNAVNPQYYRAREEFPFDERFRNAVEAEVHHLVSIQALRRQDIVFLPDEHGQFHYYRRMFDTSGLINYQLIIPHRDQVIITQLLRVSHDDHGHFGVRSTFNRLRTHVFWKGMQKDIELYIASCIPCQLKGTARDRHLNDPRIILQHPLVFRPFQRVSADLIGPLKKTKEGLQYVLVIVDHFTKWVVTCPLHNKTATEVGDALMTKFYLVYGPAEVLLCDNGSELTANKLNAYVFSAFGSYLTNTTGYHPASNGQVERINGVIKASLSKYISDVHHEDWDIFLPLVTHAINTSVNSSTGFTPYMLLYGRECRQPTYDLIPQLQHRSSMTTLQKDYVRDLITKLSILQASALHQIDASKSLYNKPSVVHRALALMDNPLYRAGDQVLIFTPMVKISNNRKLSKFWHGPYAVVDSINPTTFLVRTSLQDNTPLEPVHVSRIKPFFPRPARFATAERPLLL